MIGITSGPYNDLDNQLYGGKTLRSRMVRAARRTPLGFAAHRMAKALSRRYNSGSRRIRGGGLDSDVYGGDIFGGGWGDYGDELFGGRTRRRRRRVTAKQLRALAKGRAKLRALRRLKGGKVKRRYKSSSYDDVDYGPTARMGSQPRYSQESADRAALEIIRLINKLKNDYGWGTSDPIQGADIYPIAQKLNNLYNYIARCRRLGYDPSYDVPPLDGQWRAILKDYQKSNNVSRALRRDGPQAIKNIVRRVLQANRLDASPAAVNAAIRNGRVGAYTDETTLPGYDPNVFTD